MDYLKINHEEVSALRGLPHLQQLLYLCGIKPHMDYRTGLVGVKRGISYQSLSEVLYIEPHSGIQSGSPSKAQLRRALKGLERAGIIKIQSEDYSLVVHCLFATTTQSATNKPVIKPSDEAVQENPEKNDLKSMDHKDSDTQAVTNPSIEPGIPLSSNNNFIFLSQKFKKFWQLYPLKKSKQKSWEQFQSLQPTDELMACIFTALEKQITAHNLQLTQCQWVPGWKFPANWLAQHCWEDEINTVITLESNHANHQKRNTATQSVDPFWDSCKAGSEYVTPNRASNITNISGYRKSEETH